MRVVAAAAAAAARAAAATAAGSSAVGGVETAWIALVSVRSAGSRGQLSDALQALALQLELRGLWERAEHLYREALFIETVDCGHEHERYVRAVDGFVRVLREQKQFSEVVDVYALEVFYFRLSGGAGHANALWAEERYNSVLCGVSSEALQGLLHAAREALVMGLRVLGEPQARTPVLPMSPTDVRRRTRDHKMAVIAVQVVDNHWTAQLSEDLDASARQSVSVAASIAQSLLVAPAGVVAGAQSVSPTTANVARAAVAPQLSSRARRVIATTIAAGVARHADKARALD